MEMSEDLGNSITQPGRLGTTFHRSFTLNRPALTQVLRLAQDVDEDDAKRRCLDRSTIRELTHLGTRYVEAVPRYGYGTGLLDDKNCLTMLGNAALQHDDFLERSDTLWLMHYHLSSADGPGPLSWHDVVKTRFRTGSEFSAEEIALQIADSYRRSEGEEMSEGSARRTATAFLGTYKKDESLGRLNILDSTSSPSSSVRYRVLEPEPPSAWAFGYALLHCWRTVYGDVLTINLDSLHSEGGLGSIFLCGSGRVNRMLTTLQMEGFVDIYRVAPPFQVVLLRPDPEALLEKIYASFDTN